MKYRPLIKKYGSLLVIAGFIVFILYRYHQTGKLEESLLKNEKSTVGIITRYLKDAGSSGGDIYYNFIIDGKKYSGHHGDLTIRRKGGQELFIGKSFPVIYDSTDPNNSFMLMKLPDFEKYDYFFPDSLSWVIPYSEY